MSDISYVVEKLRDPPFSKNLSLIAFSEKTPLELLYLLIEVLHHVIPAPKKGDLRKETEEQTVVRVIDWMKMLKYHPPGDQVAFRQGLMDGDRPSIHAMFKWVLSQWQRLQQRAFVGYYLSFPEMPQEYQMSPEVQDLKAEIKLMQQEFKEVHRQYIASQVASRSRHNTLTKLQTLAEEKEHLQARVGRARAKVEGLEDFKKLHEACSAVRKQQDEERALNGELRKQRAAKDRVETAYQRSVARLRDLRSSAGEASPTLMLDQLREEVHNLRQQVQERLPKELVSRQQKLADRLEVLNAGFNMESDLQKLKQQQVSLAEEIDRIQSQKRAREAELQADKSYVALRQAQQMSGVAAKKKAELKQRLDRLNDKKQKLEEQYNRRAAQDEDAGAGLSPEQVEEWKAAIQMKIPEYRKMKQQMNEVEQEVGVLMRTDEILKEREDAAKQRVAELERQQGVEGFVEATSELEKASELKASIDEAKGATLEEISTTVGRINERIRQRKATLAPLIKDLRSAREQFQELEQEHSEKRQAYEATEMQHDSRVSQLDLEVSQLQAAVAKAETQYHLLGAAGLVLDSDIERITSPSNAQALDDKYQQELRSAEKASKELRSRKKALEASGTSGRRQGQVLSDLVSLFNKKLELASGRPSEPLMGGAATVQQFSTDAGNVMVL